MRDVCYYGVLPMKIDEEKMGWNDATDRPAFPNAIPTIYLEGSGEILCSQPCGSYSDDIVMVVGGKSVIEYCKSDFVEFLSKDKNGNTVWIDGRKTHCHDDWDEEDIDCLRNAREYTITEYDLEALEKREYKVILDKTMKFDEGDFGRMSEFVEEKCMMGTV